MTALRLASILLLSVAAASVARAHELSTFDGYQTACTKSEGITHRPGALAFKPDGEKLQMAFKTIDKTVYCKCVFEGYEKSFGRENYVRMRDYRKLFSPPGYNVVTAGQKKSAVQYSCFGAQIGRNDLKPLDFEEYSKLGKRPIPPAVRIKREGLSTRAKRKNIEAAIKMYQTDKKGELPSDLDALAPKYCSKKDLKDFWGRDFVYQPNGSEFVLFSPGPDGRPETADDIR